MHNDKTIDLLLTSNCTKTYSLDSFQESSSLVEIFGLLLKTALQNPSIILNFAPVTIHGNMEMPNCLGKFVAKTLAELSAKSILHYNKA